MNTLNINSINFTSGKTIRFADKIAREVNVQFPSLSLSLTNRYNNRHLVPKFKDGESKSWIRASKFWDMKCEIFCNRNKNYTKLSKFMKAVEEYKLADCLDRSFLALIIAKCSGLKKCSIRCLYSKEDGWLDHGVVYVADKKNPYIIDPWLGFADYLPKAFERYSGEYRKYFRRMSSYSGKNGDLYFRKNSRREFPCQSLISDWILTPRAIEKFKNTRPELFLKQKQ